MILARRLAFSTLSWLCLVSSVQAEFIVQSQGFVGRPELEKKLEFNRFDPSVGILKSVQVEFSLSIEGGSVTVDNDGAETATVPVELGSIGELYSEDARLLDESMNPLFSGTNRLATSSGSVLGLAADNGDGTTFDPTAPDAVTHPGQATATAGSGFISRDLFMDFIGTDPLFILADLDLIVSTGDLPNVSGEFEPVTAASAVTLTYEYIPEPSGWVLAGMGLFCLLLARVGRE